MSMAPVAQLDFHPHDLQNCRSHHHIGDGQVRGRPPGPQVSVSAGHHATIHGQHRSRDPGTLVRCQEENCFGNVAWLPVST